MANKNPEKCAVTKALIFDAFWKLYSKKPFNLIKVKAITDTAGFNRCTFYEYFDSMYDLLEQAEVDLIEQAHSYFETIETQLQNTSLIEKAAKMYENYGLELDVLLGPHGDPSFSTRFKERMKPLLFSSLNFEAGDAAGDILSECIFGGMMSSVAYWHQKGQQIEAKELAKLLQTFLTQGIVEASNVSHGLK